MSKTSKNHYISNPFNLFGEAMNRAFARDRSSAAIAIIVFPLLISTVQTVTNFVTDTSKTPHNGVQYRLGLILSFGFAVFFAFLNLLASCFQSGFAIAVAKREPMDVSTGVGVATSHLWRFVKTSLLVMVYLLPYFVAVVLLGVSVARVNIDYNTAMARSLVDVISIATGLIILYYGIRKAISYSLASYIIFDEEEKSVREIVKRSAELTKGRLIEVAAVGMSAVVPFVGSLIQSASSGILYMQLKEARDHDHELPPVSKLNYLVVFGLLGLMLIFLFLFVGLLIFALNLRIK